MSEALRSVYVAWPGYEERLQAVVRELTPEQLALSAGPDHATVWQLVAHLASSRVYWLAGVLGEPGETFLDDPIGQGWEDDPSHPRSASELSFALSSSFALIEGCLDRWTMEMLTERFPRDTPRGRQWHSRGQLLTRLMTHDAFHAGEISQLLGAAGFPGIELWRADATE